MIKRASALKIVRRLHQMGATDGFCVLFCGQEFHFGFQFTKEALEGDPDITVSLSYSSKSCGL